MGYCKFHLNFFVPNTKWVSNDFLGIQQLLAKVHFFWLEYPLWISHFSKSKLDDRIDKAIILTIIAKKKIIPFSLRRQRSLKKFTILHSTNNSICEINSQERNNFAIWSLFNCVHGHQNLRCKIRLDFLRNKKV
jgi:hypothetical protein